MSICPDCRNRLPDDESLEECPHCGRRLETSARTVLMRSTDVLSSPDGPDAGVESIDATQQATAMVTALWNEVPPTTDNGATIKCASLDATQTHAMPRSFSRGPQTANDQTVQESSDDVEPSDNSATFNPADRHAETMTANGMATVGGGDPSQTLIGSDETPHIGPRSFRKTTDAARSPADYELLTQLGQGGMGVVYAARQASIGRVVAVKMIKAEADRGDARQKFVTEAVITGDLEHPNIVPVYDLGSGRNGSLFYSMKRVQGTPWKSVVAQRSQTENLEILMRVADAVAFAHARGVVHCDLKPENVMLGEFGEVLVMDWGLARILPSFRRGQGLADASQIGGTPAYMAPEMALGQGSEIGPASDIYLLGAILYQILTGRPPHTGKDVLSCLMAAAQNKIVPTDKTGELVDIARKAMATKPADRYATALEFQAAIREYQSHSESILLSDRAGDDLQRARETDSYADYQQALFGYTEAHELWEGNAKALAGMGRAKLAYARSAFGKGDYDLAHGLLTADDSEHIALRHEVAVALRERESRQRKLKTARRLGFALVAALFLVMSGAAVWINSERLEAKRQEGIAKRQTLIAVSAEQEARTNLEKARRQEEIAKRQTQIAQTKEQEARNNFEEARRQEERAKRNLTESQRQQKLAEANQELARKNEDEAKTNLEEAKKQERKAIASAEEARLSLVEAQRQRDIADTQRRLAESEAYVALIGLASAEIDANAFDAARALLLNCVPRTPDAPDLRGWEWGRLMHLCSLARQTWDAGGPVHGMDLSPDGRRVASGSQGTGLVRIRDVSSGKIVSEFTPGGSYLHAVAFSPDGGQLAIGCNDPTGFLRLCDATTGKVARTFSGHTDAVVSVAFSRDGSRLLSTSYDATCRLWDVETGRLIRTFQGHDWWVWSAAFSPDEQQIVTASQDGTAVIWSTKTGEKSPPFLGHDGPVYSAAFSPDGRTVASAGHDRQIRLSRPADLQQVSLRDLSTKSTIPATPSRSLTGHADPVRTVRFTADGESLLSGGDDNTVRMWNLATGENLQTLRGHGGSVRACRLADDGQFLYSGSQDGTVRQWNVAGYAEVRRLGNQALTGHAGAVLSAEFSRDGSQIVTASRDATARTWIADSGELLWTFAEGHKYFATAATFSQDGRWLYTAGFDNSVHIWDVASGTEVDRLEGTGRFSTIALSPDGTRLLTGGAGNTARLWDVAQRRMIAELQGHTSPVTATAFGPRGALVATGDMAGHCRLWNAKSGRLVHTLDGHTRRIVDMRFLADETRLLSASADRTVGQWDTKSGEERRDSVLKHPGTVSSLALIPETRHVVTGCDDGQVRIWDADSARIIATLERDGNTQPVSVVDVSASGRYILGGSVRQQAIELWDRETGKRVRSVDAQPGEAFLDFDESEDEFRTALFAHDGSVLTIGRSATRLWDTRTGRVRMAYSANGVVASASFSPDGQRIVTGSWDRSIRIWDAASGKAVLEIKGPDSHGGYINSVQFSPDGRTILTASDDNTARVWDASTGQLRLTLSGHTDRVRSAVFSPEGTLILTASSDRTARLWDAADGTPRGVLAGHDGAVLAAQYSSDGQTIVTGSDDKTARVWTIEPDEQGAFNASLLHTLTGHSRGITSVAVSHDAPEGNRRIATAAQDGTCKVWDAASGRELLTLREHTDVLSSITFSPDGRTLLTAGWDNRAILWPARDWDENP